MARRAPPRGSEDPPGRRARRGWVFGLPTERIWLSDVSPARRCGKDAMRQCPMPATKGVSHEIRSDRSDRLRRAAQCSVGGRRARTRPRRWTRSRRRALPFRTGGTIGTTRSPGDAATRATVAAPCAGAAAAFVSRARRASGCSRSGRSASGRPSRVARRSVQRSEERCARSAPSSSSASVRNAPTSSGNGLSSSARPSSAVWTSARSSPRRRRVRGRISAKARRRSPRREARAGERRAARAGA